MDFDIVEGKEGWLFLRSDGENTPLLHACDLGTWTSAVLPRCVERMRRRCARLTVRGVPLIVLLTPESSSIYPEYLPPGIVPAFPSAAELAADALQASGIKAITPCAALRAAKQDAALFLRTDSHWSHQGAFIAYQALMAAIAGVPALRAEDVVFGTREGFGDLGVRLVPERPGLLSTAIVPGRSVHQLRHENDQHVQSLRHTRCDQGSGKLLMLRDSAANALMPFLEASFAETVLVSPSPAVPHDVLDWFQPDLVVVQVAETGLFRDEPDFADFHPRGFAERFLPPALPPPAARLRAAALTALEAGRNAVAPAAAACVLAGRHGDASLLAWALLNAAQSAGDYTACAALAGGMAEAGGSACLYYFQAQAAIHLGQKAVARSALHSALALSPGHALYLYSLAELEYRAGDWAACLDAARGALAGETLFPRAWVLAVTCLERLGDTAGAAMMMDRAAALLGAGTVRPLAQEHGIA